MEKSVSLFQEFLNKQKIAVPSFHVVLGSGFGTALEKISWNHRGDLSFPALGFPGSTVPDHAGNYRFYEKNGKVVSFQMGRLHGYEGHPASTVVKTVMVPRWVGVKKFLLTNASGGLDPSYMPGDLMLIRDHVNLTGQNPLTGSNPLGPEGKEIGPRFPDLCGMYDKEWRALLKNKAKQVGVVAHEGTYLGVGGPSFETPAEVQLFGSWGLQAVGMSTVWEAIALRHSGARFAGLSLISNHAAGMGGESLDHLEIIKTCRSSAAKIIAAVELFLADVV